ncbi:RAB6-interacting golgin isoform X10 [Syngnathus typhle]|uniref:RAB6-interacting golgin isoform X10 n=1 Tax=Syngnathus typhle TaxID=161592 RepID=UPI002A6A6CAC|nr:RAB6-interacting golgin isoform X10 [Syngnathus typhle]
MSSWAGFSESELRRLQQKDSVIASKHKLRAPGRSRQQVQREKLVQRAAQAQAEAEVQAEVQAEAQAQAQAQVCNGVVSLQLPPEQQLNKMPPECEHMAAAGSPAAKSDAQQRLIEEKTQENRQAAAETPNPLVKELDKEEIELRDKTRLEQLQREQKMIEDANKRKKALLAKTIAEKSKQTQAEAVKLKRIQKELQALDDMVSNDIAILRGKIEQASWDYTTASKRYEKAEAEYVMAKLDLHKKTDVKERLTEHLFAIIQQNERRKALKLEGLMQELKLQATEEQLESQKVEEDHVGCFELQGRAQEHHGVSEGQEGTEQWTPTDEESQKSDGLQVAHQLSHKVQPAEDWKAQGFPA